MRFSITKVLVLALASSEVAVANWFTKAAYNKWHETELERWLSDHDIPYPTPADRKDLENLVKTNWAAKVQDPASGAADSATDSFGSVKEWIFDSWTESSLKAFLDHHNIPSPQPRTRDSYLTAARQNYDAIAKKTSQYSAYPGDWLYSTWSESDLKAFLDTHGIPAPQPTTRDKLIASVRRNSRTASQQMQKVVSDASASVASGADVASSSVASGADVAASSVASAQDTVSDALFDAWSDSKLKEFFDTNGIPVPQGSRRNELLALARKYKGSVFGNDKSSASASAASAYGAATSSAGNVYAKATDDASASAEDAFNQAIGTWSESRLKGFLDSRGIPVPQSSKKDELIAKVRLHKHKASTGWSAWTFDTWTKENLQKYLSDNNKKAKKNAGATRDELMKQAQDYYASASKSGGSGYASATNYLASATDAAKDSTFDTWSDSELKSYLDSYGVPNYQGSTTNELRAMAKKQATYFKYGTSTPQATLFEKFKGAAAWIFGQLKGGAAEGKVKGEEAADSASSAAASATASIKKEL